MVDDSGICSLQGGKIAEAINEALRQPATQSGIQPTFRIISIIIQEGSTLVSFPPHRLNP